MWSLLLKRTEDDFFLLTKPDRGSRSKSILSWFQLMRTAGTRWKKWSDNYQASPLSSSADVQLETSQAFANYSIDMTCLRDIGLIVNDTNSLCAEEAATIIWEWLIRSRLASVFCSGDVKKSMWPSSYSQVIFCSKLILLETKAKGSVKKQQKRKAKPSDWNENRDYKKLKLYFN